MVFFDMLEDLVVLVERALEVGDVDDVVGFADGLNEPNAVKLEHLRLARHVAVRRRFGRVVYVLNVQLKVFREPDGGCVKRLHTTNGVTSKLMNGA